MTFLADGQDNSAWAVFGELALRPDRPHGAVPFALRYDEDEREQATLTPTHVPAPFGSVPAVTGQVRDAHVVGKPAEIDAAL